MKTVETTYSRFLKTFSEDDTVQYITDCDGGQHPMTGDIQAKLDKIDKSRRYWEMKTIENPKDDRALKFLSKFTDLYKHVNLFIDNCKLVKEA